MCTSFDDHALAFSCEILLVSPLVQYGFHNSAIPCVIQRRASSAEERGEFTRVKQNMSGHQIFEEMEFDVVFKGFLSRNI